MSAFQNRPTDITVRDVVEHIAFEVGKTPTELMLDARKSTAFTREARLAALWVAVQVTGLGVVGVARGFGRSHATAIGLLHRAAYLREWDADFRALTDRVVACLRDGLWEQAA